MTTNIKILIVDDKPENLVSLERIIDLPGVEFVRALSGNEALTKTLHHDFALVILDVQMPDMDGYETVQLLRSSKKTKYLPVIFVSAIYQEDFHIIKGIETGAVDFISKPIVPEILVVKVGWRDVYMFLPDRFFFVCLFYLQMAELVQVTRHKIVTLRAHVLNDHNRYVE